MRFLACLFVASLAAAPAAEAAQIDVRPTAVTITGDFDWSFLRGDNLGLQRTSTPYEIRLPVAGTPFDPTFVPPTPGGTPNQLQEPTTISIGNPKLVAGSQGGQVAAGVFDISPTPAGNLPLNVEPHGVVFGELIRTFDVPGGVLVRPREGDYTYNAIINMNPDYTQVLSVAAVFRVRTPVVGTDTFTEEFFAGVDTDLLPTEVQVVPLPGAVLLMGTAVVGLVALRRRAQRTNG